MFSKSTWLHLRIPFSFFLLPVYLFALSTSPNISGSRMFWVFFILHILLYPASNGYNSYFDKDEESIGGLKNPPPVSLSLYYTALCFDLVALLLGFFINWEFVVMLFVYGLVSKAYSHPSIRLKKYPFTSWLVAGFFQGCFTYMMAYIGLNDFGFANLLRPHVYIPALLSSLMLWGSYPMTQVYQHSEDSKRGDRTLSILLGIKGTFYFTGGVFSLASVGYFIYYSVYFETMYGLLFLAFLLPVVVFFGYWFLKVLRNQNKADYTHTMRLNLISAICMNAFFIYFFLSYSQLLQLFGY